MKFNNTTNETMIVEIYFPWWTAPYLNMCRLFAYLHGLEPDVEKIAETLSKNMRLKRVK